MIQSRKRCVHSCVFKDWLFGEGAKCLFNIVSLEPLCPYLSVGVVVLLCPSFCGLSQQKVELGYIELRLSQSLLAAVHWQRLAPTLSAHRSSLPPLSFQAWGGEIPTPLDMVLCTNFAATPSPCALCFLPGVWLASQCPSASPKSPQSNIQAETFKSGLVRFLGLWSPMCWLHFIAREASRGVPVAFLCCQWTWSSHRAWIINLSPTHPVLFQRECNERQMLTRCFSFWNF